MSFIKVCISLKYASPSKMYPQRGDGLMKRCDVLALYFCVARILLAAHSSQ